MRRTATDRPKPRPRCRWPPCKFGLAWTLRGPLSGTRDTLGSSSSRHVALQLTGSLVSVLTLLRVGPRQCGQLSARSDDRAATVRIQVTQSNLRMSGTPFDG